MRVQFFLRSKTVVVFDIDEPAVTCAEDLFTLTDGGATVAEFRAERVEGYRIDPPPSLE